MSDRKKIVEKIKQLRRLAEDQKGKPEGETAARMARQMMDKYQVTEFELREKERQEQKRRAQEPPRGWPWTERPPWQYRPSAPRETTWEDDDEPWGDQGEPWGDYDSDFDWLQDVFEEFLQHRAPGPPRGGVLEQLRDDAVSFAQDKVSDWVEDFFYRMRSQDDED